MWLLKSLTIYYASTLTAVVFWLFVFPGLVKHNISGTSLGNFFKFGKNFHLGLSVRHRERTGKPFNKKNK